MTLELKLDRLMGDGNANYEVIHLHVSEGDYIKPDDILMVVEGDKAAIDVTSRCAGVVKEILVQPGQVVVEGDVYLKIEPISQSMVQEQRTAKIAEPDKSEDNNYDLVVIGSGPGGYTAAYRAADLGLNVAVIERYNTMGGVCLNVGCIPSKSLLHLAKVISEAQEVYDFGVEFGKPKLDIHKIRSWKDKVLTDLTNGIRDLAGHRKVTVINGEAKFLNSHQLIVHTDEKEQQEIAFNQAIIAAGSRANKIAHLPEDPRIMDSADALALEDIPNKLLIIGGGIIGLEMASVYAAFGSEVTIAAKYDQLIPECDGDIVQPLFERVSQKYHIYLETIVSKVEAKSDGLLVHFEGNDEVLSHQVFDKILVCIGRHPNGHVLQAEQAGIYVDEAGYIPVDKHQRTNVKNIFAVGDITSKPMLAHKAIHEGKVAAEVAAGLHSRFDATVIPSVAYTDPEVAWVGLTEKEAIRKGIEYGVGVFPWAASGRALSLGRSEGKTKILFDLVTDEIIGAGIVGTGAGDLISEITVAIENKIKAHELSSTIHPHPTLSETVAFATEVFEATITDIYLGKNAAKVSSFQ
jgi:dihydrolipoyl dehydrogenase